MVDVTELLFKVTTSNDGGLDKVDQAVRKIGSDSGLSGVALQNLEKNVRSSFDNMSAAGLSFDQIIQRLANSGDTIGRGVKGSAQELQQSLKDASDAAGNLITRQRQLQQASAGLQGAITNPLQALSSAASAAATAIGPVGLVFAGLATAATFGGKALFDLVDRTSEAALATQNMALKLGISSGAMYALQSEARITGVNIAGLTMAGRQLSIALEDSSGAGHKTASALKELGVSLQDASGHARDEGAVLQNAIDQLGSIPNATQRAALGFQAFGSRSYKEIQILIDKSQSLKQSLVDLGVADQSQLIDNLAKGAENINKMSVAWDLFKSKLAEKFAPVVISVTRVITDVLAGKSQVDGPEAKAVRTGSTSILNPTIDVAGAAALKASQALAAAGQSEIDRTNPLGAASMAHGAELTRTFLASQANTESGRKAAIEANTLEIKKLTDKLTNGGLSGETAAAAASQILSLQARNAAIEDAERRAKTRESLIRQLTDDQKFPDLQSPIEFKRLIAERQKALNTVGAANASLVDASPKFGLQVIQNAITKFFQQIGESVRREADKTVAEQAKINPHDLDSEAFKKYLHDQIEISEALRGESEKQLKILNSSDRDAAKAQQEQALKIAQLEAGNGTSAIHIGTAARVASAGDLREDNLAQIKDLEDSINAQGSKSVDDEKQLAQLTTQRLQVEAEYRKEIDAAHMDAELKIAEFQRQQLDSYKSEARQIFDALRQPRGIQQWLKGQANDFLGTLFSNATAPILQRVGQTVAGAVPGQTDATGKRTALGNLLSGTILDSSRAATPQLKALDTNTAALNKLTSVLSGTTVGGQNSSASPGSPADALSQLVSSSPSSGSTAQAMQTIAGVGGPGTASTGDGGYSAGQAVLAQIAGSIPRLATPGGESNSGTILSGLKRLLGGATTGIGNYGEIFSGSTTNDAGVTTDYSTSQRLGAGIGTAAAAGAGIYESVNQFGKGGVSGIAGGIGAASGTAAILDPEPFSKSILEAVSLGSELIKALVPSGPEIRQAQIQNQTAYNAYTAPPVLNRQLSSSGGDETFTNKYGQVQASTFTSIQETQPYKYESPIKVAGSLDQNWETQPGQVIEPYQAPPSIPSFSSRYAPSTNSTVTVNVSAIDAQSIFDRGPDIATAVQQQVRNGHPVGLSLQQALIGT